MQVIDVQPSDAVDEAAWIRPRLRRFKSFQAGSVIPSGFETYARIDHHEKFGSLPPDMARRLTQIAVRHTTAPGMLWLALWDGYGFIDSDPKSRSMATLTAVWTGPPGTEVDHVAVGGPSIPPQRARSEPRIHHEARDFVLYRGSPEQVPGWWDGPNLWWPADRAWCVASEIDLPWTYLGGSSALIKEVLSDEALGAKPLSLDESTLAKDHPELPKRS